MGIYPEGGANQPQSRNSSGCTIGSIVPDSQMPALILISFGVTSPEGQGARQYKNHSAQTQWDRVTVLGPHEMALTSALGLEIA